MRSDPDPSRLLCTLTNNGALGRVCIGVNLTLSSAHIHSNGQLKDETKSNPCFQSCKPADIGTLMMADYAEKELGKKAAKVCGGGHGRG